MTAKPMVTTDSPRPQGCTNFKLRQLVRRVTQHYDTEMAAVGLKTSQYSLLSHVLKLGPLAPGALARAMTMDASTLTRNLKPLLEAGWVDMQPGADGRTRSVSITPLGRDKRTEAQRRWRAAQDGLNAVLGLHNVAALHALIDESLTLLEPHQPTEP
ncbi:MAG: MarR family transcriptional regulator [Ideonella sp. MAG2]|nr:MAG: MarR family transcriptional regulator [Ideonella sp. MAG2]